MDCARDEAAKFAQSERASLSFLFRGGVTYYVTLEISGF